MRRSGQGEGRTCHDLREGDHAPSSCREMFQQTLMVLLVNTWHNESSVPPPLFPFPTVQILKSVESPSLLHVCTFSSLTVLSFGQCVHPPTSFILSLSFFHHIFSPIPSSSCFSSVPIISCQYKHTST